MNRMIMVFTLLCSFSSFANDCNVYIINLGSNYPQKVYKALESRGYKAVESISEATYTVGEFGFSNVIGWRSSAMLEHLESGEQIYGTGNALFSNTAFAKAIKNLPQCGLK